MLPLSALLRGASPMRASSSLSAARLPPSRGLRLAVPAALASPRTQLRNLPVAATCTTLGVQSLRRSGFSTSAARGYSTEADTSKPSSSASPSPSPSFSGPSSMPRVRTLFLLLTLSAAALTTYGLVQFLASFRTWPKEVRVHLRRALKAENALEFRKAEEGYRTALSVASSLPTSTLGPDAPLKLSGLSIALGSLLESQDKVLDAYAVYASALSTLQQSISAAPSAPPPTWRMRAVALSQRLGELAQSKEVRGKLEEEEDKGVPSWAKGRDAAEAHLVWSVEELLRLSMPGSKVAAAAADGTSLADPPAAQAPAKEVQLSELNLPAWITPTDLGASLEALGALYAARHEAELAAPLFLHALSILLPPPESNSGAAKRPPPTAAERCQASVLMSNLALVYLSAAAQTTSSSAEAAARAHAKEWAERGLALTQATSKAAGWTTKNPRGEVVESSEARTREVRNQCVAAEITLLYNLGCMAETAGDKCSAREYLQRAYRRAEQFGQREARSRCASALSRLERVG